MSQLQKSSVLFFLILLFPYKYICQTPRPKHTQSPNTGHATFCVITESRLIPLYSLLQTATDRMTSWIERSLIRFTRTWLSWASLNFKLEAPYSWLSII